MYSANSCPTSSTIPYSERTFILAAKSGFIRRHIATFRFAKNWSVLREKFMYIWIKKVPKRILKLIRIQGHIRTRPSPHILHNLQGQGRGLQASRPRPNIPDFILCICVCGKWRAHVWLSCRCVFTTSRVTSSLPGSRHFRPRPPALSRRRWWRWRAGAWTERAPPTEGKHHVLTARLTAAGCWSPAAVSAHPGTSLQTNSTTSAPVRICIRMSLRKILSLFHLCF